MKSLRRLLLLIIFTSLEPDGRVSQTFFMPRSATQNSSFELALQGYRVYHNNYSPHHKPYEKPTGRALLNIQNNYFYQESDNQAGLSEYFLPFGNSEVSVAQNGGDETIASKWLGVERNDANFSSTLKLKPQRKTYGTILNYYHDLSYVLDGLWFSTMLPIMKAEHRLNADEVILGEPGEEGGIRTILDGLNQSSFKAGKFGRVSSDVGFDDMQVKLGCDLVLQEDSRVGFYGNLTVPLGGKPSAEFVFGHVLGNGNHLGLGGGTNFEVLLADYDKHKFTFLGDVRYRYLFSATEERSFDLVNNGPWSRYLQVVRKGNATEPLAGINFFTKDVKVTPRDTAEVLAAIHYSHSDFGLETGYNMWWRNSEKLELKEGINEDIGIFNPSAMLADDGTASTARISQGFGDVTPDANDEFILIQDSDLDLMSATHKTSMSHLLYAGASFDAVFLDSPWMIGAGGAYEFARDNAAMNNWSIWLKTCFSF